MYTLRVSRPQAEVPPPPQQQQQQPAEAAAAAAAAAAAWYCGVECEWEGLGRAGAGRGEKCHCSSLGCCLSIDTMAVFEREDGRGGWTAFSDVSCPLATLAAARALSNTLAGRPRDFQGSIQQVRIS